MNTIFKKIIELLIFFFLNKIVNLEKNKNLIFLHFKNQILNIKKKNI